MTATQEMLAPDKISFTAACRENTGRSLLDSGFENGRAWQQPNIPEDAPVVQMDRRYPLEPTLMTGPFLDSVMDIDRDLQARFMDWLADREAGLDRWHKPSWFEAGAEFMEEVLGYTCHSRGNVYNGENHLSQVYVWEVWGAVDVSDWIYETEKTVSVFYMHTGADVRGGYGRPIFSRSNIDYSIPMDVVLGVSVYDARGAERDKYGQFVGPEDRWGHSRYLGEEWEIGYHGDPVYRFSQDVERVFGWTANEDDATICVLLTTGERVKVGYYAQVDF